MRHRVLLLALGLSAPLLTACSGDDGGGGAGGEASTSSISHASSTHGSSVSDGASTSSSGGAGGSGGRGGGGGADPCAGPEPGPDNTGVPPGVTLTPSGTIDVTDDGAVIDGLDIQGEVHVLANDVTIRNCRITSGDYYPIRYFDNHNTGLLVEDTEIHGTNGDVTSAIAFDHYTARRVNVHGSSDGFKADSHVLIEDCYVHDLSNGPGEHNDCVQSTGGPGVTLRHNHFEGASNAAVQTGDEGGVPTEDMTIQCSWLHGGGYTLNIRGTGATRPVGTTIVDNFFYHDSGYGPITIDDPNPTFEGNTFGDTGDPSRTRSYLNSR